MENKDNLFGVEPILDGQFEEEETQENEVQEEEDSSPIEGQDGEQQEEQQTQELILGKFKSQDDLVNAYRNLEREHTRLRQQNKVAPKEEQPQQTISEEEQIMSWFNEKVQTDPYQAIIGLSQHMAKKEVDQYRQQIEQQYQPILEERNFQQQLTTIANKYKDFYDYQNQISQEIELIGQEEPDLLKDPKIFEIAYFRGKSRTLEEKAKTAFENGKKSILESRKQKQQVNNEQSKANHEEDAIPEGINIIPGGDGIFI